MPADPDPATSQHRSVRLHRRRILVDGVPTLLLGGEVHYFRLARPDWRVRLQQLKDAGANTVATYVPWLWHELPDGSHDLTGETHEQRDLAGYLDLAAAMGLFVVVRPGPFIMAEVKNEGVPYRVYDEPGVLPTTWDGATVPTRTADYLAPAFLAASRQWYAAVLPVVSRRLLPHGGSVVGVQLDNEIGMLSWVTNSPDLTDVVCAGLRDWALDRWGADEVSRRAGADARDPAAFAAVLRSPPEAASLPVHHLIGLYSRERYRRYVEVLREEAEKNGIRGVPLFVNVHGTDAGRGRTYPIGLSQLAETWRGQPQLTAGSDLYLGDLTVENVADLYVANAFAASVQGDDQPLASLEFEGGNGDYSEDLSAANPPEAVELKLRLCLAQGNRLLNVYLFAGGHNPPLAEPVGDGNDRIAFTGQRHGFAAPVGPEGQLNPTYGSTRRAMTSVRGVSGLIADMDQLYDGLALGFVPDHYLTEYRHPASPSRAAQVADLERFRGMGPRDVLARAMVLGGYSFPAVDLQQGSLDPVAVPVLALASASTLDAEVQRRLLRYLEAGGRLLLNGLLPDRDHQGVPCTDLADGLGLSVTGKVEAGLHCFPSVVPHGWAAPGAEVRVNVAQRLDGPEADLVLSEVGTGRPVAVEVAVGAGRALVLACDYPCHLDFWHRAFESLGVQRRWVAEVDVPGLVVTPTADVRGQQLLHLVHVGSSPATFTLTRDGEPFLDGRALRMPARSVLTLPVDVAVGPAVLLGSTAELVGCTGDEVTLRRSQDEDVVLLGAGVVVETSAGRVDRRGDRVVVTLGPGDGAGDLVRLRLSATSP